MNEIHTDRVPRRRWFRFSLRTLFLLVTVLGVWLGLHIQAMRRQQESVAAIEKLGGKCYYDFQDRSPQPVEPDLTATSPVPNWLRDWIGDDFFHNITNVNLVYHYDAQNRRTDNSRGTGEDLKCLMGFPKLKALFLHEGQASDAGLAYVGQLNHLEQFFIWDATDVSDVGVAHLSRLRHLKSIHISKSKISDESLKVFAEMPQLEYLSLQENHFTNQGLENLREMIQLKSLSVGIGDIRGITDDGLVHLKGLVNLEKLDLQGATITAAGLEHLKGLKKLQKLYIHKNKIGDVSDLQSALPNCKIN